MASPLSLLIGLRFSRGRRRSGMGFPYLRDLHHRYRPGRGGSNRGLKRHEWL